MLIIEILISMIGVFILMFLAFIVGTVKKDNSVTKFVFGKLWLKLVGKDSEPKSKIIRDTIIMIPTSFFTILFIEIMLDLTGMNEIVPALLLNLLLWIGFVATIEINQNNFNDRGVKLFLIEYGFYLVGFLIAGIILSLCI